MKKVRVLQYVVQPVLVTDDGENLEPLPIAPVTVPAAGLRAWVETGLQNAMDTLEAELNPEETMVEEPGQD